MASKSNPTLARLWYEEMWSRPDLAVADQIVDPDYAPEWIQIPSRGPEQVKHEIRYFRSVFPDLRYEILDAIAQTDRVWIRYRGTGTQRGNAWGFEATGRQVTFEGATILYTNSAGKVIDRWGAFSFYDILFDLGLVPPFWELSRHFGRSDDQS